MLRSGTPIGMYTIDKMLSDKGGMSQVYLAYVTERSRYKVIIKVNLTTGSPDTFQDLLKRETNILSQLHHPNIVHIFPLQVGRRSVFTARTDPSGPWYYVMEYILYEDLEKHANRIAKKMTIEWALELFYQIVITVHYMHQRGYAHCDLKPQNILLRRPPVANEIPAPVLIDFGSATPVTHMNQITASVRYSPPEVLMALDRPDIPTYQHIRADKVDIWGLGVVLFEIVTGRPLFNQRKKDAVTTTILRGHRTEMREVRRDVHDSLDKLLSVMLRRNPMDRPDTGVIIRAVEERISSIRSPRIPV